MSISNKIIEYETEGLRPCKEVELFQELVESGLAWSLQGAYGRRAMQFIEADLIYGVNGLTKENISGSKLLICEACPNCDDCEDSPFHEPQEDGIENEVL